MSLADDADEVASIVANRLNADFIRALMAAHAHFSELEFEAALAASLRARPELVDQWATYSADQRWTPAAYVRGTEAGWYDGSYQEVIRHDDEAAAVADFIRRTAAYLDANRAEAPKDG